MKKTYTLAQKLDVLKYTGRHFRLHDILAYHAQLYEDGKVLTSSQEIRLAKLGKARTKLEQAVLSPIVKIWRWSFVSVSLKCVICICQFNENTYRELIVSRYIAESITTDAGCFGHVGLCQLRTKL